MRRFNRYRLSADAEAAQIDATGSWLREQIRAQLCAYGPDYEDRRQNAWVAMLLLGEPALHDGLLESIGERTRPGVRLSHVFSGVDLEFVDLVNANWDHLSKHFGEDQLFLLLASARTIDQGEGSRSAARHEILLQLTKAPSLHPRIHDLVVTAAESDSSFRSDPAFLTWSHRNGRRDAALFEACVTALNTRRFNEEPNGLYEILVDAAAWDVSEATAKEVIQNHKRFDTSEALRSLFAERFPNHPATRAWYAELEEWFRIEGARHPRQWPETLALAISAAPAAVLPTIIARAHEQLHRQEIAGIFRDLTAPLLRRLRGDPEAVAQMHEAMLDPCAAGDGRTPLWQSTRVPGPLTPDAAVRLKYLYARSLQRAGMLTAEVAAEIGATLLVSSAAVVAHDPFVGLEGSLRNLSGLLTRQQR